MAMTRRRRTVVVTAVMRSWAAALLTTIGQRDSTSTTLISVPISACIGPCFVHLRHVAL